MLKNIIFVAIACYDSLQRVVIMNDRQDLKEFLTCQSYITKSVWHIRTVAEYSFKGKLTKYYTLEEFLSS